MISLDASCSDDDEEISFASPKKKQKSKTPDYVLAICLDSEGVVSHYKTIPYGKFLKFGYFPEKVTDITQRHGSSMLDIEGKAWCNLKSDEYVAFQKENKCVVVILYIF